MKEIRLLDMFVYNKPNVIGSIVPRMTNVMTFSVVFRI